jgi:hypothetical protein
MAVGVQIAAARWREDLALAAAAVVEHALGGWSPPPLLTALSHRHVHCTARAGGSSACISPTVAPLEAPTNRMAAAGGGAVAGLQFS